MLDAGQVAAAHAIGGSGQLVLIVGAAGAGKTSVLAASDLLAAQNERMVVVAPTRKAAIVASSEIDTQADTAGDRIDELIARRIAAQIPSHPGMSVAHSCISVPGLPAGTICTSRCILSSA
jgi:predicted ABC-type ATPase